MTTFYPLLIPVSLGFLISINLLKGARIPNKSFFSLVVSAPLGLSCISLILFWAYVFGSSHAGLIASFVSSASTAGLLIFSFLPHGPKSMARILKPDPVPDRQASSALGKIGAFLLFVVFLFAMAMFIEYFVNYSSWNLRGGWDARCLWNLKARFLFRSPEEWHRMFSPALSYSLPDYPLLLPACVAWGWIFSESELLFWPFVVSLAFFLPSCGLVIWYIGSYHSLWKAFIAATFLLSLPTFRFWTTALYADIPLAFSITAASLLLIVGFRSQGKGLFFFSGLFAGLSAWTKNEGIIFCVWSFFIFAVVLLFASRRLKKRRVTSLFFWLAGAIIPLIAVLYLKCIFGGSGVYLGSNRTIHDYWPLLTDSGRIRFILSCFYVLMMRSDWNGLWILFSFAIVFNLIFPHKCRFRHYRWIPLAVVLLIESGYTFIYLITPFELGFHIQTSMNRLLFHTGILALIFSFDTFSLMTKKSFFNPKPVFAKPQNA